MRLVTKIILGLSAFVLIALGLWGTVFYFSLVGELTEEIDETLADYSNDIIVWSLAGEPLPYSDAVAYNTFDIMEVTPEYAAVNNRIRYWESVTYIQSQDEDVPARNRSCIFMDADDRYYELTVSVPTIERDSVSEHIFKWTVILYVVLLLAIVGIDISVVRRNLRPLDQLLQWLDSYSRGERPGPVPVDSKVVEFRRLSAAAQEAVDRLESQNDEQRAFIGNVSHELQTPLAVCTARVDSLLADPEVTEGQAVELMKLGRSLRDVSRLNSTLLMLHRIDNDQFPESERVDFSELVEEGVGGIVFSPLNQGMLTDRYLNGVPADSRAARGGFLKPEALTDEVMAKIRALNGIAAGRGQTLAEMAIAWLLGRPGVTSALIGASRPEQIRDVVAGLRNLDFTAEELAGIERILG